MKFLLTSDSDSAVNLPLVGAYHSLPVAVLCDSSSTSCIACFLATLGERECVRKSFILFAE